MQSSPTNQPEDQLAPPEQEGPEPTAAQAAEPTANENPTTPSETELTAELARIEDRYRRALADLDNYRKRAAREIEQRVAESSESVLRDWLEAVDSVERALRMQPDSACRDGLEAVLAQMHAALARQGAETIGAAGDAFDPERHEAVAVQTAEDVPDRTVVAVERSGYALGGRVIRPAQVVVARAPEPAR